MYKAVRLIIANSVFCILVVYKQCIKNTLATRLQTVTTVNSPNAVCDQSLPEADQGRCERVVWPCGAAVQSENVLNHTSLAAALLSAGEGVRSGAPLSAVARVCCQEESL